MMIPERLIGEINDEMYQKIVENRSVKDTDARGTAQIVGLSAIKYGDLSNQASKDYVFDVERFTSFEGNTGPYILYTIVRTKSILGKYKEEGNELKKGFPYPVSTALWRTHSRRKHRIRSVLISTSLQTSSTISTTRPRS